MTSQIQNQDFKQNWWHLTCIQTASLGVPGIILGKSLANTYGPNAAILSSLIANLVLWVVGFTIVSMAIKERRNAIENAEVYIGKFGAKLISLISIAGFPIWYVVQIQATTNPINNAIFGETAHHSFATALYGTLLGISIAIFAFKNPIRLIKKVNTIFLPVLLGYYFYWSFYFDKNIHFPDKIEFSLSCTMAYIAFLFSGMVNLPTFFRHARSRFDSYISLTFITLIIIFFQISSIWMGNDILDGYFFKPFSNSSDGSLLMMKIVNILFAFALLFCSNLVNIYFAYPSWEAIIPKIKKYAEFFIIGLVGSFLYFLIWVFPSLFELLKDFADISDNFTADLGITLVLMFLLRLVVRHRPKPFEKLFSTIAWMTGCAVLVYAEMQNYEVPLLSGIGATVLFFILIWFIEEPFWSMKKLKQLLNRS